MLESRAKKKLLEDLQSSGSPFQEKWTEEGSCHKTLSVYFPSQILPDLLILFCTVFFTQLLTQNY